MNFKGAALPLADGDVVTIAGYLGCQIATVRAVLAVESAGKGFGSDGRPIILNEPHVFYRELKGAQRELAVEAGLAYPKWGTKPYPASQDARYEWLARAMSINETAALRSCSWGLGQLMGFNHKVCGFDTPQDMVEAMCRSEGAQLFAMARFIVSNGLQDELRRLDWSGFARGYNGSGYAKNAYHTKLAAAYKRRPAAEKVTPPAASLAALDALLSAGEASQSPAPVTPPVSPGNQPDIKAPAEHWLVRLIKALLGR
jgi:hypothetical protein